MKTLLFLCVISVASFNVANGQGSTRSNQLLIVSPSKFKLQAANVAYQGKECSPSEKTDKEYTDRSEVVRIGDEAFYESIHFFRVSRGDGLVIENFNARTCRLFPMFGLAEAAGWIRPGENRYYPDATRGIYRVGSTLWMGSNGIGLAVLDLSQKTWSRYDLKSNVIAGDHLQLNYADDNYVFATRGEFPGTSLHVYSVKQNKWLGLKAVSTKLVREYGYTTEVVQVPTDHRVFASQKYIPIDWTFMSVKVVDKGDLYSFVNKFTNTQTVFEISKSQLEQAFKALRS